MIETRRLILRPWRPEDAEALFKYASDSRVSELALWPTHTSADMSRMVIEEIFMPNPFSFAMVLKETDEPVGCIGLVPQGYEHYVVSTNEREVGYWIGYPHWGHGLTSEALDGLIGYLRGVPGIESLLITADSRNVASHRVAEKCGFRHIEDYIHDEIPSKAFRLEIGRAHV